MPTSLSDTQPKGWMWMAISEVTSAMQIYPYHKSLLIWVSNHLDIYLVYLITNTTGQWPSDIKQFSAMSSFLSHRKTKQKMKEGEKKREKKRQKKNIVKISLNRKAQYQIIFPKAKWQQNMRNQSPELQMKNSALRRHPVSHPIIVSPVISQPVNCTYTQFCWCTLGY